MNFCGLIVTSLWKRTYIIDGVTILMINDSNDCFAGIIDRFKLGMWLNYSDVEQKLFKPQFAENMFANGKK